MSSFRRRQQLGRAVVSPRHSSASLPSNPRQGPRSKREEIFGGTAALRTVRAWRCLQHAPRVSVKPNLLQILTFHVVSQGQYCAPIGVTHWKAVVNQHTLLPC